MEDIFNTFISFLETENRQINILSFDDNNIICESFIIENMDDYDFFIDIISSYFDINTYVGFNVLDDNEKYSKEFILGTNDIEKIFGNLV